MSSDEANRRQLFRLNYPDAARPALVVGQALVFVTQLSERGLRVAASNVLNRGGYVEGVLHMRCGRKLNISGRIDRQEGDQIVLVEVEGVSLEDLVEEQRLLIRMFSRPEAADQ